MVRLFNQIVAIIIFIFTANVIRKKVMVAVWMENMVIYFIYCPNVTFKVSNNPTFWVQLILSLIRFIELFVRVFPFRGENPKFWSRKFSASYLSVWFHCISQYISYSMYYFYYLILSWNFYLVLAYNYGFSAMTPSPSPKCQWKWRYLPLPLSNCISICNGDATDPLYAIIAPFVLPASRPHPHRTICTG